MIRSGEGWNDPSLLGASRLPNSSLKGLWNAADEYFDSLAHGFPDALGMPIDVARERIVAALHQLEAEGKITDDLILAYDRFRT